MRIALAQIWQETHTFSPLPTGLREFEANGLLTGHDNTIIWKRSDAHSDVGQGAKHLGKICDYIFYYT